MQVSVEAPSKLERRLTITVPVQQLDEAIEQRINKLAKTAKLKGFRPGKVPLSHVKQQFGDAARHEALSDVIQSSLYTAISQQKLNPVAMPTVEPKAIVPGQPLEYVATFEVLPEIEQIHFTAKEIEKTVTTVTEADINTVVERLCEQHITWQEVKRAAQNKDQLTIDFKGTIDGKVFPGGEAHDFVMVLGSNRMIPGFEEGLIGAEKGEKILTITFPADYFAKEVAGKKAEFTIQVRKISEPKLPTLDEALIKKLGIASGKVDELHAEIRKNLEREVERILKNKLKASVFDLLLEQNPIEVPNALVQQETKRVHDEVHPHHGKEHSHTESEMAVFEEAAKKNVKLGLLVSEFIKQHKLSADKSRVQAHLSHLAAVYENPAEIIQWYSSDKKRLAEIEMQVLEEQVMEKMLEGVALVEKVLDYNELLAS